MTAETRKGIISFSITDRGALYSSYMSFLSDGGVFIPTPRSYELGDKVFVLLKLMDEVSLLPFEGKVVWITPAGAQGNKVQGIGVQLVDDERNLVKDSIEQHLAANLQGERPTQTMYFRGALGFVRN